MIDLQNKLVGELEITKREIIEDEIDDDLKQKVIELIKGKIDDAINTSDKLEREGKIADLHTEAQAHFEESHPESEKTINGFVGDELKTAFREQILSKGVRSDGRKTTDIRDISIETDIMPRTHGSALFTRGETQAIVVLTMGTPRDEQIIDSMDLDMKKKFFLHYNFPPYCVGETGRIGFTGPVSYTHLTLPTKA